MYFIDNAGPVCGPGWPKPGKNLLKISRGFSTAWKTGLVPRHMMYMGRRDIDGKAAHEVLWRGKIYRLRPYDIGYLKLSDRGEDIQADDRASDLVKKREKHKNES